MHVLALGQLRWAWIGKHANKCAHAREHMS